MRMEGEDGYPSDRWVGFAGRELELRGFFRVFSDFGA